MDLFSRQPRVAPAVVREVALRTSNVHGFVFVFESPILFDVYKMPQVSATINVDNCVCNTIFRHSSIV